MRVGGAPACFYPARALIEVDGDHLGVDPATVDPANLADRARYAVTWGLLTHECAHAKHSVWEPPDDVPTRCRGAAMLLEESRMEAAHVRRRPQTTGTGCARQRRTWSSPTSPDHPARAHR